MYIIRYLLNGNLELEEFDYLNEAEDRFKEMYKFEYVELCELSKDKTGFDTITILRVIDSKLPRYKYVLKWRLDDRQEIKEEIIFQENASMLDVLEQSIYTNCGKVIGMDCIKYDK